MQKKNFEKRGITLPVSNARRGARESEHLVTTPKLTRQDFGHLLLYSDVVIRMWSFQKLKFYFIFKILYNSNPLTYWPLNVIYYFYDIKLHILISKIPKSAYISKFPMVRKM